MQAAQLVAHQCSSAVQAAADGPDTHFQHSGDRFVVESIDLAQHQHGAEFFAERVQRRLDLFGAFGAQHLFGRWSAGIGRISACATGRLIDRYFGASTAAAIHGGIEGDAIQPGIEGAVLAKGTEFEQRLDKSVLHDVLGFLPLSDHVHDAGEEPILIAAHELTEGGGIALQSLFDQLSFVRHVELESITTRSVSTRMEGHVDPQGGHVLVSSGAKPTLELGCWLDPAAVIFLPMALVVKLVCRFWLDFLSSVSAVIARV